MGYKIPNGGTFHHAATYAVALAFTAISNASEAVATVAAPRHLVMVTSSQSRTVSTIVWHLVERGF
jgi:hypothetical protein